METRLSYDHYLLSPLDQITGNKFPSNKQALGRILHIKMYNRNITNREASRLVVGEIEQFWEKARIPTKYEHNSIDKLEALYQSYRGLKRHRDRRTATTKSNEDLFCDKFDDLFDIAHERAMEMITIQEDKDFLVAQREKGRRGSMGGLDLKLAAAEERKRKIVQSEKKTRQFKEAALLHTR